MNLYLTVCRLERRTSKILYLIYSSPKGSVHSIKFRFCFFNNALPHQLDTMQGKVLKFETFMAIRIDFMNDFTCLLHFYFSENAKVRKTIRRKN